MGDHSDSNAPQFLETVAQAPRLRARRLFEGMQCDGLACPLHPLCASPLDRGDAAHRTICFLWEGSSGQQRGLAGCGTPRSPRQKRSAHRRAPGTTAGFIPLRRRSDFKRRRSDSVSVGSIFVHWFVASFGGAPPPAAEAARAQRHRAGGALRGRQGKSEDSPRESRQAERSRDLSAREDRAGARGPRSEHRAVGRSRCTQ